MAINKRVNRRINNAQKVLASLDRPQGTEEPQASILQEDATKGSTYEIVEKKGFKGIKCLRCGMTSFNDNDIKYRYCGNCHSYHV